MFLKQKRKTTKEIISNFLMERKPKVIRYHMFEEVRNFAQNKYGILHNIGTYERAFRSFKNDSGLLRTLGIRLKDVSHLYPSAENTWEVTYAD